MIPVQVIPAINDVQWAGMSAGFDVPAGVNGVAPHQVEFDVNMPAAQVADPTNFARIRALADFGKGVEWQPQEISWQGGAGQSQPKLVYAFDPKHPPRRVYCFLENGFAGAGSWAAITNVTAIAS